MLVPLSRLLRRSSARAEESAGVRPAAVESAKLRARYAAQPGRWLATAEQRALARRLIELKRALAAAFGATSSCAECARGEPLPKGRWDGGRCCGTNTFVVFTPAEVAALKLAGVDPTREAAQLPGRAAAGGDPAAGCLFRGPGGCSLTADARPTVCLVYACDELRRELARDEARASLHALRAELHETFERFLAACGLPPDRAPPPTSLVSR